MIDVPVHWIARHEPVELRMTHPAGAQVATITYRERVRPLVKAGAALDELLAEHPHFACDARPDCVERLVTREGEYAALATLRGTEAGRTTQRDVGFVFGDDFYARVSGCCHRPELFDAMTRLVRELVMADTHALGVRRRRFDYAPPAGWQPLVRGFATDWLVPEYARAPAWLSVSPALPVQHVPPQFPRRLIDGGRAGARLSRVRVSPRRLANGLAGELAEAELFVGDRSVAKLCGVLRDGRYAYTFDATAATEAQLDVHREELERVFASTCPLPAPEVRSAPPAVSPHSFWAE